jgi:hypothetical protein
MIRLVASFASAEALQDALPKLRRLGSIETYTPSPLHDDVPSSILPLIVLIAGFGGAALGFAMQVYADTVAYPIDIGGRPDFSWPSFVPIAFEIGVLSAVVAGVFAYFVVNRLPHLYDPIDEASLMRRASRDCWCVAISTETPDRVRDTLRTVAAEQVEEVE